MSASTSLKKQSPNHKSQIVCNQLDHQLSIIFKPLSLSLSLSLIHIYVLELIKIEANMEMKLLWLYYGIAFLALAILMPNGWAQDTSCLNQLAPCLNYLNGTRNPPDSCCNPLKSVIKSNPKCLCSLISIKSSRKAEQAGINVNQAQMLPGRCGQNVNPISCLSVSSMHLIMFSITSSKF